MRRRGQGEPLQHLLGTVEFADHVFVSDKRALIPRPETEQLVEYLCDLAWPEDPAHARCRDRQRRHRALPRRPFSKRRTACRRSFRGRPRARARKCRAARPSRTASIFRRAICSTRSEGAFDLIVANLPYVAASEAAQLAPEVRHDPPVALYGGTAGDELIRELIAAAPPHLQPGGTPRARDRDRPGKAASARLPRGEKLPRHQLEKRLCRDRSVPLRPVWIRFSFTAVIRSLVRSRSAARKIRPCRSSPRPCSRAIRASSIACPT